MHVNRSSWLVMLLVCLFCVALRIEAQGITTGTIVGVVVDPQGAVIPNAEVTARNVATGVVLRTTSLSSGDFAFRAVPVGTYRVEIESPGFRQATVANVPVTSGNTSDLKNVRLTVGAANQVVHVSGSGTALLHPTESQVTTTFSTQQMQDLPLNNGFDTVTEVIPGVASTHMDNFSNFNGDNYSVNGQSGRNNNSELDGQSNNDNSVGGPQIFFGNQDAIAEIQVITNDYAAQYGRNAGAVVNYITKSGTNEYHGSAFELYQGQALSSLTNGEKTPLFGYCAPGQNASTGCAPVTMPRFVENRYGATLGGAIIKSHLFAFGSTFWDRLFTGVVPSQSLPELSPTPAGLSDLAAAFPGDPAVTMLKAISPYAISTGNPQPIASSETTESVVGPGGTSATIPVSGVSRSIATPFTDEENMGRLDWQPEGGDHLFLRYFYQTQLSQGISGGSIAAGDWVSVPDTNNSIGADWTHTFSSHWVDQLRYSFQESKVDFEGGAVPGCTVNTLTACNTFIDFTSSNDLSLGINPGFPQGRTVKVTQIQNNATWAPGRHTILFGGEFDYQNSPNVFLPLYNGDYLYSNLSSFMQDSGALLLADGNPVIPFTEPDTALYVQDDWKATSTLTAHIGVRWEYFSQAINKLHEESVARESNPNTAFWDTSLPLADRTVPSVSEFYGGIEPRIGFAWNPTFDPKLVVSGGYAINANPAFYNIFLIDAIASPVANTNGIDCSGNCVPADGGATAAAVRGQDLSSLPRGGDPRFNDETYVPTNFRTPYVQTYTLGIQHQLGASGVASIRYVGVKTTDNFQSVDANPYLLPVASAFPSYSLGTTLCSDPTAPGYGRPNCNYANLAWVTNGGWADYNGLELNLTTRNYHGLTGTVSYTYSREIDNNTDVFGTGAAGSTTAFAQNPLNTDQGERGVDGNSYPNVVGASFLYTLPKLIRTDGVLSRIVNGFTLSSLYRYDSGQPFNALQPLTLDPITGDTSFCDYAFNSSSVGAGNDPCRLVLSNPKAPMQTVAYLNPYTGTPTSGPTPTTQPAWVEYNSDSTTVAGGYNPGTLMDPTSAHWIINNQAYALAVGNPYPGSGRNILRGDPFSDLDVNLFKSIPVTERVRVEFQIDGYNVLNQMFRGTGGADVALYSPGTIGNVNPFLSTAYNVESTVPGDASGQRFFLYGAKILF